MAENGLKAAFVAGFEISYEGWNGEYGADFKEVEERFDIWFAALTTEPENPATP